VSNNSPQKDKRYDLWGWILFTLSALLFIVSSLRNGDIVGLLGGVFFLLACVAFLAPYIGNHKD
jgi:Kef-type K+ transport system membrane component KefB